MSYELRDHTADVAVQASGDSLGEVFAAVADGMAAAMCDRCPGTGDRFRIAVTAESPEALLFDFLDELIYQRDVREVLPVEHEATVDRTDDVWSVSASARGIPLADVAAREIKAVTYSEMKLVERAGRWEAYVVFDV